MLLLYITTITLLSYISNKDKPQLTITVTVLSDPYYISHVYVRHSFKVIYDY